MQAIVVGSNGKMGKVLCELMQRENIGCVAKVDSSYTEMKDNEYKSLNEFVGVADVLIDFSHHSSIYGIVDYIEKTHIPSIIATTGHTENEIKLIHKASNIAPIFYSGNYSLGIAVLCKAIKQVVSLLPNADIEIIETHHKGKLDAPSGTAKMILDSIKEVKEGIVGLEGRKGYGKKQEGEIGVHSIRSGEIVGIHEVVISSEFEQIVLSHQAYDRKAFAKGALNASKIIINKNKGLYTMREIIETL